ncbi:MAG: hypothetical protein WCI05_00705 [Myxococcales bacterium]
MSARTLTYRTGLLTLFRELLYTLAQMGEEPLAAAFIPTFQALREKWQKTLIEEIALLEALTKAQAAVDRADGALDRFVTRVSHVVDDHTAGSTRKQLRMALFKGKAISRFRRPVLGRQLMEMTEWASMLAKCGVAALSVLAPEAEVLHAAGRNAEALRAAAQRANREFRDLGTRKQLFDEINASRKEADGALAKLPFQNPALPQDFSDGFFYSQAPRDEEETLEDVKGSIGELEAQLAERRALLKLMEDDAAAQKKTEEEQRTQTQKADDLEAQAQALLAQAAGLRVKGK